MVQGFKILGIALENHLDRRDRDSYFLALAFTLSSLPQSAAQELPVIKAVSFIKFGKVVLSGRLPSSTRLLPFAKQARGVSSPLERVTERDGRSVKR